MDNAIEEFKIFNVREKFNFYTKMYLAMKNWGIKNLAIKWRKKSINLIEQDINLINKENINEKFENNDENNKNLTNILFKNEVLSYIEIFIIYKP